MTHQRFANDATVSPRTAPPGIPPSLYGDWNTIAATTAPADNFDHAMLDETPAAVRRWLVQAIAPGTPLLRAVTIRQHGEIKVQGWRPYTADWALAPTRGFIWAATTRFGPLSIRGYDRYTNGTGEMRWRLLGKIPLLSATGADIARSALGRLAGESCFLPAFALDPAMRWEALDDRRAVATMDIARHEQRITIGVNDDGSLHRVDLRRWGQPTGKAFGLHLFTAIFDGPQVTFDGFTIPARTRAGWWHCPDRCATEEFIRFTVDDAHYQ